MHNHELIFAESPELLMVEALLFDTLNSFLIAF